MRIIVALVLSALIVGCTHPVTRYLNDAMDHANHDTIAQKFGPPDKTYRLDSGGDVWTYQYCQGGGALVGNRYTGVYGVSRQQCTNINLTFDQTGTFRDWRTN